MLKQHNDSKTKISNSLNREHCKASYIESERKALTYSTLTQAASETDSGRKKGKNPSLTKKVFSTCLTRHLAYYLHWQNPVLKTNKQDNTDVKLFIQGEKAYDSNPGLFAKSVNSDTTKVVGTFTELWHLVFTELLGWWKKILFLILKN